MEENMFTVTDSARAEVAQYFKSHDKGAIRIFLFEGGCGGPQLAMAVDERKDSDAVYEISDVEYLIEKDLLAKAQPIQIDFAVNGFTIASVLPQGGGCSGCGSTSSCCST
jgi:iron-sulfur cluster assembly protein